LKIDEPFDAIDQQYPDDESPIGRIVSDISSTGLGFASSYGVPHLAFASAVVGGMKRVLSGSREARMEAFIRELVHRVKRLDSAYKGLEEDNKRLRVDVKDLESAIQVAILCDANSCATLAAPG
jgi:hypothetical protein